MNVVLEKYMDNEPTKEMREFYQKRTREHIDRVSKNIHQILHEYKLDLTKQQKEELKTRATHHDASKFSEEELIPYVWMTWYYKLKREGKEFTYPIGMEAKVTKAVDHHYKTNRHHPQYFDNVTAKMSFVDLIEMVCDHAAMSQELGDSLIDFEKNVTFKKFEWSEIDKDFILRVASLFHK